MKKIVFLSSLFLFAVCEFTLAQKAVHNKASVSYVNEFKNSNHPQIGYWFFSTDMLENDRYIPFLDSIVINTKFDFIFLTAREKMNFYEFKKLTPVFKKLVCYAHSKNIKIGLQLWENRSIPPIELTERFISDGEVLLDSNGSGSFTGSVKYVRDLSNVTKSELFKVYAFEKTEEGFYNKKTLVDVTQHCIAVSPQKDSVLVNLNLGKIYKGYTAFIMLQHYTKALCHYTKEASDRLVVAMKAYADIPFDGIALDEYSRIHILQPGKMEEQKEVFRERVYSLPFSEKFKTETGTSLEQALLDMRYAPTGHPEIRAVAINRYMDVMRKSSLGVENIMYEKAKEIYGSKTFIGTHNTFHNSLINDEIWATGCTWWSIKRDYGHTDEYSFLPTQMGIAMANKRNVLYNMFYTKDIKKFTEKALTDLRYGIRTHYHAFNDKHGFGVSLEKPEAYKNINPVETGARLLNQFNPALPEIKVLVIFGMEALSNWYPNVKNRGTYDINDKLEIEEKAVALWNAGYANALIPTDLIIENKLSIDANGKPVMNGHKFDAVVFLYPEYSKEPVLQFLEKYLAKGGKLMIEGSANLDFNGNNISSRMRAITNKATINHFSIDEIAKLGISKNTLADGCKSSDGSYVFTNLKSLQSDEFATSSINISGDKYIITYKGLAAIKADKKDGLEKFTAESFKQLSKNGQIILEIDKPANIYMIKNGVNNIITIEDPTKKIIVNKLFSIPHN